MDSRVSGAPNGELETIPNLGAYHPEGTNHSAWLRCKQEERRRYIVQLSGGNADPKQALRMSYRARQGALERGSHGQTHSLDGRKYIVGEVALIGLNASCMQLAEDITWDRIIEK